MSTDITGRSSGHPGIALRCPGCGVSMRALDLQDAKAEVDVCDACDGLWVDWFDGEVRALATETLRAEKPASAENDRRSNDPVAVGACPRCAKQLVPERYVVASDSLPPGAGAELRRCEDCMGAFVTRASAEALAFVAPADAPPPSVGSRSMPPVPWDRFVRVIKSFLGLAK